MCLCTLGRVYRCVWTDLKATIQGHGCCSIYRYFSFDLWFQILQFGHPTVNPVAVGDEINKVYVGTNIWEMNHNCISALHLQKRKVQELELVAGNGVYLTRRQLDECVDGAGSSSTRLMRNLLNVFFTPDQLAKSSAMGTRVHKGLDQDILSACISEY